MAGQRIFNLGNWQNLDVDTMTNLFLYGELGTPINYCDRIAPWTFGVSDLMRNLAARRLV